jgi:hypothetical protein
MRHDPDIAGVFEFECPCHIPQKPFSPLRTSQFSIINPKFLAKLLNQPKTPSRPNHLGLR